MVQVLGIGNLGEQPKLMNLTAEQIRKSLLAQTQALNAVRNFDRNKGVTRRELQDFYIFNIGELEKALSEIKTEDEINPMIETKTEQSNLLIPALLIGALLVLV